MAHRVVSRRIALLLACLVPVLASTCGEGGSGGGQSVTSVSGRVATSDGSGVPGATVTVSGLSSGFGCTPPAPRSTTTDAGGYFTFSTTDQSVTGGTVTVTPYLGGYVFDPPQRSVAISRGDAVTRVDFVARPLPHVVSGRIATTGGAPVPGATVVLGGGALPASTSTDRNGLYRFAGLPNGTYTVTPSVAGANFDPKARTASVNSADVSDIDFEALGYLVAGRVGDRSSPGVAGVTVSLSGSASAQTATDAEGYFAFVAQPGSYAVAPSMAASGYGFAPASRDATVAAADRTGLDFIMESWVVSGTVTATSGGGVPGVRIALSGTEPAESATDGQGRFAFAVYRNGPYTLTPSLNGYSFTPAGRNLTVDRADLPGQDFATRAFAVSGRVALGGAGVAGVTVDLSGPAPASAVTDAAGAFSFLVAQDGSYTVTPSTACPTYTFSPPSRTVTVSGTDNAGQDFSGSYLSESTHALAGRVATPGGAGIPGLTVTLNGAASATAATSPDGAYDFSGLRNGSYTLAPVSAEYAFAPASRSQGICNADAAGQDFAATRTWARSYHGIGYERARDIRQTTPDLGYIVAGSTTVGGSPASDAWILKLKRNGEIAWQRTYGGPGTDSIEAIHVTADGYIAVGSTSSSGAGGTDAWVMKLDTAGNILWQKTYGGAGDDRLASVRQIAGGNFIVAGSTNSFRQGGSDAWVMELDDAGGIVWQKTYGGTGWKHAAGVRETADGGLLVAGSTDAHAAGTPGYQDLWVFKLDSGGNVTWQKSYGGYGDDAANSVEPTADGGCIVAGATSLASAGGIGPTGDRFWLLKLDGNGNPDWQNTYGGTGGDRAFSVVQTSDNGYVAAGTTYSFGRGYFDLWAVKLNEFGTVAWQKAYGGAAAAGEMGYAVRQTADGGYVVAGSSDEDFLVLKIDPGGGTEACGLGRDTSATPTGTGFAPVVTAASVTNVTAAVTAATATSTDISASVTLFCPSP